MVTSPLRAFLVATVSPRSRAFPAVGTPPLHKEGSSNDSPINLRCRGAATPATCHCGMVTSLLRAFLLATVSPRSRAFPTVGTPPLHKKGVFK